MNQSVKSQQANCRLFWNRLSCPFPVLCNVLRINFSCSWSFHRRSHTKQAFSFYGQPATRLPKVSCEHMGRNREKLNPCQQKKSNNGNREDLNKVERRFYPLIECNNSTVVLWRHQLNFLRIVFN